jgi:hypothetical protein
LGIITKACKKYETQQKALELALEGLENNSNQLPELTLGQKFWLVYESIDSVCCIQKGALRILMETVNLEQFAEYVIRKKPIECVLEYFLQKPLKECSLKEIVDGLTTVFRLSHLFEKVEYKDNNDY